ncbi:MAG: TonB-dependent receptor, partial [Bacteroidales bacterium]|nr:TonB-dependent receptor [Bacteroidales bacterium]
TINTLSKDFKYPQTFRANIGYDHDFGQGWKLTLDAIYSKTLNNVYFRNLAINHVANVYGVNASVGNPAPYYNTVSSDYSAIVALGNTNKGYTYSLSGQIQKHFDFGLDLMASYTFGHAYSVNDGGSSVAYSNWKYNYSMDSNSDSEVSWSIFDKPHKINFVAMYTTPIYGKRFSTSVSLTYEGGSGQRFSHTMRESSVDFNGDGYYGNTMLYIPTKEEISKMNFASPADMFKFEKYIQEDSYLHNHRGDWAPRYAGLAPWENHFDLQVAQDFYYDLKKMRKIQLFVNILNISNLFNREWGLYYTGSQNRTVLQVDSLTPDEYGNMTPTYSYYDQNYLTLSDFYSRWRCQVGMRISF